jgi:predicted methyltransferase
MPKTLMRTIAFAALIGVSACQTMTAPPTATSPWIVSAVADPARPAADTVRDADRKPAEMIAFGEVHPGEKIGELIPGGGYMTRILSKAVGPTGHVYLFNGPPRAAGQPQGFQPVLDDTANYANTSFIQTDFTTIPAPEPLDMVWTSQNYHDMHNPGRNLDINKANQAVKAALKPGGIYIVLDHQSAKGVDFDAALHRINMQKVKDEVLAAGFEFVAESFVLDNPNDDGTKMVFDPSIRGKTDQFILKFRKPG